MPSTVHVSNISHDTSEKEVRDFFSFCGKISSLSITPVSSEAGGFQSATVTFEKKAAAETARLLDQTQLGKSQVHVEAASNFDDLAGPTATEVENKGEEHISQEDKPRSRILAEYLAHGYVIRNQAIESAIDLDQKHGFSNRFTTVLNAFDEKFKATKRAQELDKEHQLREKAATGWRGLSHYFERAIEHPSGQKLRGFYTETAKQIRDVHTEANRLADLKQGKTETPTESATVPSQPEVTSAAFPSQPGAAPETAAAPAAPAAPVDPKV